MFTKTLLLAASLLAITGAAQAESLTYSIEPTHTFVTFEARHFGTSTNRGRFDKKEGVITLDKAAKSGKVEVTIDTTSINTGVAPFDGHLKSKDFFNTSEFPTAKFVGDKFTFDGDKVKSVAGKLTLAGQTQPVTLVASNFNCYMSPMLKREVCGADAEGEFNRADFGMTKAADGEWGKSKIEIQVEALKDG